jgi:hypothetical protein
VVRGGSPAGPQAVSEEHGLQKLYQTLDELKIHPRVLVLKLPLSASLQRKVGELFISVTCHSIITLEKIL